LGDGLWVFLVGEQRGSAEAAGREFSNRRQGGTQRRSRAAGSAAVRRSTVNRPRASAASCACT